MLVFRLAKAATAADVVFSATVLPAAAQNGVEDQINRQISQMLTQERAVISAVTADRLRELSGLADARIAGQSVSRTSLGPDGRGEIVLAMQEEANGFAERRIAVVQPIDRQILDAMPAASGDAEWECLTKALYFEARGETTAGQIAVAEVILNRVDHARYPDTVCRVVSQGAHRMNASLRRDF